MATPVRHTTSPAQQPVGGGRAPVLGPLGWLLIIAAALTAIIASWTIYPLDNQGMWASYRADVLGTIAILAAMWLRTSLPAAPALALTALCGVILVLCAVFLGDVRQIFVIELVSGILMLVGTALAATGGGR